MSLLLFFLLLLYCYNLIQIIGVQEIGDEATTSLYTEQITTDVEFVSDQNHCNEMKEAY